MQAGKDICVSVLMLTYNQEEYVDSAIESVVAQRTDFDVELVIGDDCSTDSTVARCHRWVERFPEKIRLLESERNGGLLANFARTFAECHGRYIAICEGDDYWTDNSKLQRQVNVLEAHPEYSTSIHRVVNYYQDRGTMSLSNGGQKAVLDIMDLARMNFISNVSAVFRNTLKGTVPEWISEVGTYDYAVHMLNADNGAVHYMNRPMAVYRKHSGAIWSQSGKEKQWIIAMKVRLCLMNHYRERRPDVCRLLSEAYVNNGVALAAYYQQTGEAEKAQAVVEEMLKNAMSLDMATAENRIKALVQRGEVKPPFAKRLKVSLREFVSRLIPVPKPCKL